jgi:hypothetical protein
MNENETTRSSGEAVPIFLVRLISLIVRICNILLLGFVFSQLWNWFIPKIFKVGIFLTAFQGYAIILLAGLLYVTQNFFLLYQLDQLGKKKQNKPTVSQILGASLAFTFLLLIFWFIGWIFSLLI